MKTNVLFLLLAISAGLWGFIFSAFLFKTAFFKKSILETRLEKVKKRVKTEVAKNVSEDDFTRSHEFEFKIFEEYLKGGKLSEYIKTELLKAGLDYKIDSFLIFCAFCATPFVIIITFILPPLFFLGFLGFFIPIIFLKIMTSKRARMFEQQFPDTLDLLAGSLRAGHSLYGSFELIVEEMPKPVSEVFKTTVDEISFGADIKDAILSLAKTMPDNMDLKFFITSVIIQREVGGNLVKILTTLSDTIRERFKILGQLRAQTAQSKLSGMMLSAVPPIICIIIFLISPEYMEPLLKTQQGHSVMLISITLTVLAAYIIKKILTIEV